VSPGQALVEFALVLPLITILLFGLIDLGLATFAYSSVTNAARTGARVASVNQTEFSITCDPSIVVRDPLNPKLSAKTCAANSTGWLRLRPDDVVVEYVAPVGSSVACGGRLVNVGCSARVTVRYEYRFVTPLISSLLAPISFASTSEMPVERVFP
jgi:Flp pilus assembly protein TadG